MKKGLVVSVIVSALLLAMAINHEPATELQAGYIPNIFMSGWEHTNLHVIDAERDTTLYVVNSWGNDSGMHAGGTMYATGITGAAAGVHFYMVQDGKNIKIDIFESVADGGNDSLAVGNGSNSKIFYMGGIWNASNMYLNQYIYGDSLRIVYDHNSIDAGYIQINIWQKRM